MAIRHTCDTCAHNGCCVDLPNCGGTYWKQAEDEDGRDDGDPYDDYPDPYEQWEHDSEVWQAQMDRRY